MEPTEQTLRDPVRSAFVTAVSVLEAGRASLLLRENGEPVLTVTASVGIAPSLVPSIRVPVGEGIAGLVAARGLSLFGAFNHQTFVSIPVVTERGVEGVLNLTERLGGQHFTAADIIPATAMTRHIAELLDYCRLAARDPVSRLPNRQAFNEAIEREVARAERTGSELVVVFIDVDNLKAVNDHLGHSTGDELIRRTGEALQSIIRQYDYAARYGGDEFVLLLSGADHGHDDGDIADTTGAGGELRLRGRVERAIERSVAHMGLGAGASIGIARYPADGTSAAQLLAAADARMYEHKRAKRG